MTGYIIIAVFVLMVVLFIYIEYKNNKKHQEIKPPKHPRTKKEDNESINKPRKVPSAKELDEDRRVEDRRLEERRAKQRRAKEQKEREDKEKRLEEQRAEERRVEKRRTEERRIKEEKAKAETKAVPESVVSEKVDLPECNYPKFDHSRLLEMGLGEDEAQEFVAELIPQIEAQIPLIKEAMDASDMHNIERLTHSIKGSSTTVGTGGISDLLIEFNTYLKEGEDAAIVERYFEQLKHYHKELEKQYT